MVIGKYLTFYVDTTSTRLSCVMKEILTKHTDDQLPSHLNLNDHHQSNHRIHRILIELTHDSRDRPKSKYSFMT